jgi:hypothetical protein
MEETMTIQQDAPEANDKKIAAKDEGASAGLAEPIHLRREFGDTWVDSWLGFDVVIPPDAPPEVLAAGEHAARVQADRDRWVHELHLARPAARVPLAKRVAELMGTESPELVKARRALTDHDTDSNIIATDVIPQADQAVNDAWWRLSAALRADWGNLQGVAYSKAPAMAEIALRHAEGFLHAASELQRLEDMHAGVGIVRKVITTGAEQEANFAREERRQTLHSYAGLMDLVHSYREALKPPPAAEAEPEPVPRAVQNQRRHKGLHPLTGQPVDPFTISD